MAGNGPEERVDALIVTAVKDEYEAVLAVHTGAVAGSEWEKHEAERFQLDREPTPELLQRIETFDAKTSDVSSGEG